MRRCIAEFMTLHLSTFLENHQIFIKIRSTVGTITLEKNTNNYWLGGHILVVFVKLVNIFTIQTKNTDISVFSKSKLTSRNVIALYYAEIINTAQTWVSVVISRCMIKYFTFCAGTAPTWLSCLYSSLHVYAGPVLYWGRDSWSSICELLNSYIW